jgi:hypothetical protein
MPVVAALVVALGADPVLLAMPAALAASWGFMLPAGTGPNAIAWATGRVPLSSMVARICLAVPAKDPPHCLGRDAGAGIDHLDQQLVGQQAVLRTGVKANAAAVGELHGVANKVEQHLPQPQRVPFDRKRHLRIDHAGERDALFPRPWLEHGGTIAKLLVEAHLATLHWHTACFQPRKIKDVVEQPDHRLPAFGNVIHAAPLFIGQRALTAQQIRKAQHTVHGRADIVAHAGKEVRLRLDLAAQPADG